MSLADRVKQLPETVHGYPCSVGKLMAQLESQPDELATLQLIMYGRVGLTAPRHGYKGLTEAAVFRVVTDEGYEVAKNQINEHRGKRCRCYKATV